MGDAELIHQSTSNHAGDVAVSGLFRQIDKPNRSQLFRRTSEPGLGHAHGPVRRLAGHFVLLVNAVNLGKTNLLGVG